MKHLRSVLVSFFKSLTVDMDSVTGVEQYDIHELRSKFMAANPKENCPSDNQIRWAADEVFKHGGYDGNAKVWITEKTWLREKVTTLQKEVERLNALLWNRSHAGKVLATKAS
jgi:hypothetical protein